MLTKENTNVPVAEITKENYLVPKNETHLYHIKMEVTSFDQRSGKRLSHPVIQKFQLINVENGILSLLRQQGYSLEILHDPKEWKEKMAAEAKKAIEAKKVTEAAEAKPKKKAAPKTAKKTEETGDAEPDLS